MFTDWVVLKTNLTPNPMIKVPEYSPVVMKNFFVFLNFKLKKWLVLSLQWLWQILV